MTIKFGLNVLTVMVIPLSPPRHTGCHDIVTTIVTRWLSAVETCPFDLNKSTDGLHTLCLGDRSSYKVMNYFIYYIFSIDKITTSTSWEFSYTSTKYRVCMATVYNTNLYMHVLVLFMIWFLVKKRSSSYDSVLIRLVIWYRKHDKKALVISNWLLKLVGL